MPEKDDTVVIYFPTREEEMAVGMASKGGDKIGDPSIKYFRTASGKEIKISSDEVLITCINGENKETGEKQIVYIKLNQSSGVEITSTNPISFISEKGIKLEAEETIEITAKEKESEKTIFSGIPMNVEIKQLAQQKEIKIVLYSYSILLDFKEKRRSFQNKGQSVLETDFITYQVERLKSYELGDKI